MEVLGLDIGGANLKAAHTQGIAKTVPFALWKAPQELPGQLEKLIAQFPPFDQLAVTMTGELCDCFASKREGVAAILASVEQVAGQTPVQVWSSAEHFMTVESARQNCWLGVASANWLAQAAMFAKFSGKLPMLLIDIGSTTTDIIPILEGKPAPQGFSDTDRLETRELCYTGVRRTPVCAFLQGQYAAELFATMHDVYLILGDVPEDPNDCDTADHRPATKMNAESRLARMICRDPAPMATNLVKGLAKKVKKRQVEKIAGCLQHVEEKMAAPAKLIIASGSGAFLVTEVIQAACFRNAPRVFFVEEHVGKDIASATCAYAVALLALELAEQVG